MFRGKESSNRNQIISISSRLIECWCFGLPAALGVGGGCMGIKGCWGYPHTFAHARICRHMHTHTHMPGKHDNFMQMAAPIGESLGIPYDVIHAYTCVPMLTCMCVCMRAPHHHPPPTFTHPPTSQGGTTGISQNSIALELMEIFQFCLKIWNLWRLPHPWVGVWFGEWVGGWVGRWVGSGQNTKNLKIVDWIKIIQFSLKIYDL